MSIALKGRARVNRLLSERAKEREDPTLAQLADYGSDEEREGREGSARPQAQGQEEEHILTAENILRTSPVYDLHRTIMTGAEVPSSRI